MPWASQQTHVCCQPHLALAEVCGAVRAAVRRVGRLVGAHAQHATLPHPRVGVHLVTVSIAWNQLLMLSASPDSFSKQDHRTRCPQARWVRMAKHNFFCNARCKACKSPADSGKLSPHRQQCCLRT